jgi:septation ring formation regulator EzrA
LPTSNTTVLINQTYQEYSALIGTLDYNITDLEKRNASLGDVDDLKAILESIKNKINQSKTYIDNGDYVNAKIVLDQAKNLMGQFSAKADSVGFREIAVQVSNPLDITIIVIVVVIVAIIAVVIYLFWPSAKEKQIMLKYEFKRKR